MPYLNCPRCQLAVRLRADAVDMQDCPRCSRRTGLAIPLFKSDALRRHTLFDPRFSGHDDPHRPLAPPGT